MVRPSSWMALAAVGLALASVWNGGCGSAQPSAKEANATTNETTRRLRGLFDAEWDLAMREHPMWASQVGDPRGRDRWDDVSLAAQARRDAHDREVLAKVAGIRRDDLSPSDALSYDLFRHDLEDGIAAQPLRMSLLAVNHMFGIQVADDLADSLPFTTVKDFADWNARLESFPRYMDQTIELLTEGVRTGMVHPRVVAERVASQIDGQIVDDPTKSPFFAPYQKAAASSATAAISLEERERLATEAKRTIAERVVPAYRKFRDFWKTTYLPASKEDVGAWHLPDGRALYAWSVRHYTTTKLTPDEVHALGLREVARIRAELETAKAKAGFKGTLKELFTYLRTNPGFFYKDGTELLTGYRDVAKRIDPQLVKLFRKLPRTPYGVSPIPNHLAPNVMTAYYREPAGDGSRAGTFFVNLLHPESRPKWEMTALTLHEAVPGHHLQIALAMEQEDLPRFRRHAEYTAFVEGWALYAESLGEEMGLYDDPYSKIGQLTYEMWRAIRLVVDTGMHHLKWDRQRAIDFFLENSGRAELDITNEVDRYIAWPGQALAYKIGEI